MNLHFKLLTSLFLFLAHFSLLAAETGYEVELIIFEDANARYIQSEDWSYNDMLNNKKGGVIESKNIETEPEPDPEYKQLVWDGAKLGSQLDRLLKNNNYRVLTFKRWKQTGLSKDKAFDISIDKEQKIEPENLTENTDVAINTENAPETLNDEEPTVFDDTPYITGNVKLIMSRYLHFNINIQYIRPYKNENDEINNKIFPIINERRMRSREIHYIDHPLVGIIVLATPYEIVDSEEQNDDNKSHTEYKTM